MRALSFFAALVFAVVATVTTTNVFVHALTLNKYPALQCSACKAVCEILGDKMNETAAKKQTVLKSHRLEAGKVGDRRVDYESSELRGYELLENLCEQNNYGSYMLREERRTGLRIFSREAGLQQCLPYDDEDRTDLHDTMSSKYINKICTELVEEHEEHIVGLIKELRQLEQLQDAFCSKKAKVCSGKRYDKGVKEDLARRAAWRKRTGIRTGTDVDMEKEAEAQKKKQQEEEQQAGSADPAASTIAATPVESEIVQQATKNNDDDNNNEKKPTTDL